MNKADSTAQLVYHQGQSHQIIQTQIYPKKNQWIVIYEGILNKEHDIEDSSAYILGNYPFNCQQNWTPFPILAMFTFISGVT